MNQTINGKKEGYWETYYSNGNLNMKGHYKNGKKEGYSEFFWKNGNYQKMGEFKMGKKCGQWSYFDNSGNLSSVGNYQNGNKEGKWNVFYWQFKFTAKGSYKNGLKEGVWETIQSNGEIVEFGYYENNMKEGLWKHYYENGKIAALETYENVDYMDLFKSLEQAFNDYTTEAFSGYEKSDIEGLLKDRLQKGKERLDEALESIKALVEPVEPPKGTIEHICYFCGNNTENPDDLKDTEPRRVALYKLTIALIRAYANIADEMNEAGYTEKETEEIKTDIKHFGNLRKEIQLASGDHIELKEYEPAMRFLIDSYIGAEDSRQLAAFDDMGLVDMLVEEPEKAYKTLPESITKNPEAMAETIENNLRKVIIEETPANPMYYEKMSVLLDELIKMRKEATLEYEKYLKDIIALSKKVKKPSTTTYYPATINRNAKRALYDNLGKNEAIATELDEKIMTTKKDGWRDNIQKSKAVRNAIREALTIHGITDDNEVHRIFELVKNQSDY